MEPQAINPLFLPTRQPQRVAVLVTFPDGVTEERADEIARYWCRTAQLDEQPTLTETTTFNPDHGGVVIYQP